MCLKNTFSNYTKLSILDVFHGVFHYPSGILLPFEKVTYKIGILTMSKITNILIPFILISTGVLSCTSQGIVRKQDIMNQQFVNTINQNDTYQQVQPQPYGKDVASQTGYVRIPTKKKSSTTNDIRNKHAVNNATAVEKDVETQRATNFVRRSELVFSNDVDTIENDPTHGGFSPTNLVEKSETEDGKERINNLPVEQARLPSVGQAGKKSLNQISLAHLDLGIVYAEKGRIDEAIWEFKSAIEVDPHHLESHVRLGRAYGSKGMTDKALSEFRKAIDIDLNEAIAKIAFDASPVNADPKEKNG